MCIKSILILFCLAQLVSASGYLKRADFDDPRMFSSAYGKRSGGGYLAAPGISDYDDQPTQKYIALRVRRHDFEDPRFMSMSFGKRSVIDEIHDYATNKRAEADDPRFYSGSFGKK
ncbi:unnamed protein product [Caenorhabditis angaria]|uniref:Uncharacterized protein n=1 Tax=Caenorhabditis angaria TaxID=860376 RepID=A0A9P1J1H3_9PELO|nr:unnamed protein product [Caenorhabditis angaria]